MENIFREDTAGAIEDYEGFFAEAHDTFGETAVGLLRDYARGAITREDVERKFSEHLSAALAMVDGMNASKLAAADGIEE